MTAATLRVDLEEVRRRTRWTMTASIVLHALLFLWIATQKSIAIDLPIVTEIMVLTPGELAAMSAPAAPAAPAPQVVSGASSRPVSKDERFERHDKDADLALDPATDRSVADQLSARLAAMTRDDRAKRRQNGVLNDLAGPFRQPEPVLWGDLLWMITNQVGARQQFSQDPVLGVDAVEQVVHR